MGIRTGRNMSIHMRLFMLSPFYVYEFLVEVPALFLELELDSYESE